MRASRRGSYPPPITISVFVDPGRGDTAGMSATLPNHRAWLYTDSSMIVRVMERPMEDGRVEVIADGPAVLRGRHFVPTRMDAAQFRYLLERQLAAGGFAKIWQSQGSC